MTNLIVGLTGVQGVLPYIYTHKIKQSTRAHREESLHFLGLFNHKLTAQYVDACLNYHLPLRYEIEQENHYLNMLHALSGYSGQQHEQQPRDDYFAEFSGLMQGQNNTHYALSSILSCIFKYQFEINEFIPESFQLDDQQKSGLGALQPVLLGINSFCGETIQQIDEKIEIVIGPLKREDYLNFLSEGIHSSKLKQLLQTWCSPTMLVDLRLILDKDELCPAQLGEVDSMGLARGALLMPNQAIHNAETCYSLIGKMS
jgi:type VI secretion system protein ImpH